MYVPDSHFTTSLLLTWRSCTVQLFPARATYYVYLCHFSEAFRHAKHYMGCSSAIDDRLLAHEQGRGARLMEVIREHGIRFELVRLWPCASYEEMRELERHLKRQHNGPLHCSRCNKHLAPDPLVMLRQGHYPFHLFDKPGKRQPMLTCLVERMCHV